MPWTVVSDNIQMQVLAKLSHDPPPPPPPPPKKKKKNKKIKGINENSLFVTFLF